MRPARPKGVRVLAARVNRAMLRRHPEPNRVSRGDRQEGSSQIHQVNDRKIRPLAPVRPGLAGVPPAALAPVATVAVVGVRSRRVPGPATLATAMEATAVAFLRACPATTAVTR